MSRRDSDERVSASRYDPTSEQYLLVAALRNRDVLEDLVDRIRPDDVYADVDRTIWDVLREIVERDLVFDIATFARVAAELDYADADWGGDGYLEDLLDAYPDVSEENIDFHVRQSRLEARLRVAAEEDGEDLSAAMTRPGADPSQVAALARSFLSKVVRISQDSENEGLARSGSTAAEDYRTVLARRREGRNDHVPFGLPELDALLTWGALPGKVTSIVARPSVGKSAFGYSLAKWRVDLCERGHLDDPRPVLAMPLEMGETSFIDGLVSRASGVSCDKLVKSFDTLDLAEQVKVAAAVDAYVDSPWISFFDEPGASLDRVEEILAAEMEDDPDRPGERRSRYGLVLWDLFDKSLEDLDHRTIANALNRAQEIAKRYRTHLVLFAQIRRGGERRSDKRPNREEIKGSGGWEESSDQILALHRERVYDPECEDDELEIGILKQKLGAFGQWLTFEFDAETFSVGANVDSSAR